MDTNIAASLERIVEYLFWDEIKDWEACGRPAEDHIYLDVLAVDEWLDRQPNRRKLRKAARQP